MNTSIEIIDPRRGAELVPGGGLPVLPGAPAGGGGGGLAMVHRLLRGRYLLAILLGLAGAIAGASAGWLHGKELYTSEGQIYIQAELTPLMAQIPENRSSNPRSFVEMQIKRLKSPAVIDEVVNSESWKMLGRPGGPEGQRWIKQMLMVGTDVRVPELINVAFMDPNQRAAQIVVEQIIRAYESQFSDKQRIDDVKKIDQLKVVLEQKSQLIDDLSGRMLTEAKEFGTDDLTVMKERTQRRVADMQEELDRIERELANRAAAAERKPGDAEDANSRTPNEIAAVDNQMRQYLQDRINLNTEIEGLQVSLGDKHPELRSRREKLALLDEMVKNYAKIWNERAKAGPVANPNPGVVVPLLESTDQLQAKRQSVAKLLDQYRAEDHRVGNAKLRVDPLREQLLYERGQYKEARQRIDQFTIESRSLNGLTGRIQIENYGSLPDEAKDSRKKWAAVGLVAGGGAPIALILLIGLFDRRFRYSDEAGEAGANAPLLGILPHLPKHLGSPEDAAAAAHCVHRIRSLLQLAGPARKTYAVTSAVAGDGKTSLALSLGLSYAASGSRTLLMDFDLVGAGLTSSLSAKTDHGIGDVLGGAEAQTRIVPTRTDGLWLLPCGRSDDKYTSRLSASLVSRTIDSVRDAYDVIIIDTGPILGSLEAAFVSSVVDGVILVVGRGRHRSHVERALAQLNSVGANLMGIVFNRASSFDFRKSVTSGSMRSVGEHHPPPGPDHPSTTRNKELRRLSPVAQTVVIDVQSVSDAPSNGAAGPANGAAHDSDSHDDSSAAGRPSGRAASRDRN